MAVKSDDELAVPCLGTYGDRAAGGELHRVRQQVDDDLDESVPVPDGRWQPGQHVHDQAQAGVLDQGSGRGGRSLDDVRGLSDCLYRIGDVELARGDSPVAHEYGERTLALARRIGAADLEASALRGIGEAVLQQGYIEEAAASLDRAWQLQQEIGDPYDQALILAALVRLALARGDTVQASAHIEAGLALAHEQGAPYLTDLLRGLKREVGGSG